VVSVQKDIHKLLRQAERAGFRVIRDTRHFKVVAPGGQTIGVSRSPDPPALKKIAHDLKKAGLRL